MSFYQLSLLVILFAPWVTPREVYFDVRKNSAEEEAEGSREKLTGDTAFPVINNLVVKVASHAKAWAQWLRRLLKAMRKWCNSHPPEVKLGKCFASYFNIKIPALRRNEKIDGYYDYPKETRHPSNSKRISRPPKGDAGVEKLSRKRMTKTLVSLEKPAGKAFVTSLRDASNRILERLHHYHDAFFKNQLISCMWDYFLKKFWTWVDSAPDSRLSL